MKVRTELLPTVRKAIAEGLACGASTDMWTDDHRKVSYTCITLHYIDNAWEFNTRIICTCAFPSGAKKTALNLKTELLKQLGEFCLVPDEIGRLVFVSDQGAKCAGSALPMGAQKLYNTRTEYSAEAHL